MKGSINQVVTRQIIELKSDLWRRYFPLLFVSLLLISCDPFRIVDQNSEIKNASWQQNDGRKFSFEVEDTSLIYSVLINLRNNNDYPFSNIYLFVEMTSPSEKYFMDTLQFNLADQTGKWLGSGIGNIWQNHIPLVEGVKMNEIGTYRIVLNHGMRQESLPGITDVGIRVEGR